MTYKKEESICMRGLTWTPTSVGGFLDVSGRPLVISGCFLAISWCFWVFPGYF